ncbi:MAG: hypothetical protein AB7J13_01000 [Pyrinomonadaceae bacterium]
MVLQTISPIFGDLLERILQFLVGKGIAIGKQFPELAENLLDCLDIAFIAVYEKLVSASTDIYVEQRFEILDVLVVDAKKCVKPLGW